MVNRTGAWKRGGDGLAGIDLAREHDAGHRRIDGRLGKVGLRRGELGAGLGDLRLRPSATPATRAPVLGAGGVELGLATAPGRRRPGTPPPAGRDWRAPAPPVASAVATCAWAEARPACAWTSVSCSRAVSSRASGWPWVDAVIIVDEDLGDQARLLGADLDLVGRLEIAGRRDGDAEVAAPHRLGRIAALAPSPAKQRDSRKMRPTSTTMPTMKSGLLYQGLAAGAPRKSSSVASSASPGRSWCASRRSSGRFQCRERRSDPSRRPGRDRAGRGRAPRRRGCWRGRRARRRRRALGLEQGAGSRSGPSDTGCGRGSRCWSRPRARSRTATCRSRAAREREQRVLDILERGQHRLAIGGERALGRRLLRAELRAQPAAVEQGLVDAGEDRAGDRAEQAAEREGRGADIPGQAQRRIELRLGDADPRGRGGERALGRADVGALAQRVGGDADGDVAPARAGSAWPRLSSAVSAPGARPVSTASR